MRTYTPSKSQIRAEWNRNIRLKHRKFVSNRNIPPNSHPWVQTEYNSLHDLLAVVDNIAKIEAQWQAQSNISLKNIRVADEIDLLLTKEGTGRSVDIADISFLESKIRGKLAKIMPEASFEVASEIFARYYDYEVCHSALSNPDPKVSGLALRILRDSAADGDPFAAKILREQQHR